MGSRSTYLETFDDGPGGWIADTGLPLPIWDRSAYCHGPWTIDANHAPPGAGYLHLLMYLCTSYDAYSKQLASIGGANRFIDGGPLCNNSGFRPQWQSGERPEMVLLAQAKFPHAGPNYVLTGQPLAIGKDWTEQTLTLTADEDQWTFLGARHDLTQLYSHAPISEVLADVNYDLILRLFICD